MIKEGILLINENLQMYLLHLPNELLQVIFQDLGSLRDINALAQTNRQFYSVFNPHLYSSNIRHHNSSALIWAAEHGQMQTAKNMIREGVNVKSVAPLGMVPLHIAAFNGHDKMTSLLVAHGAHPEQKGLFGRTPLHEAARAGREAVAKFFIGQGVDPEPIDADGRTPLHAATCGGHEKVVKVLLKKYSKLKLLDSKDLLGCTPLLYAAGGGCNAVVIHLIAEGADPEAKDLYGRTPLHLAAYNGHEATTKLLIELRGGLQSEIQVGPQRFPHWLSRGDEANDRLLVVLDQNLRDHATWSSTHRHPGKAQ